MSTWTSLSDERATEKQVDIPTVIAAGCSDVLLARCWNALAGLAVMVRDCDLAALPTLAAARKPLAIVVARTNDASATAELTALARDVGATLIEVDHPLGAHDLESTLSLLVRAALLRREGRTASGRYSILPGDPIPSCPPFPAPAPFGIEDLEEEMLAMVR
ncbi:hypothetical protein A7982_13208 [Minicystis rosea]|nr:hypothetical protein A7982_13208 [Minicystis rosea]